MRRLIPTLFAALLALAAGPVRAHFVPAPCDFITGGGFVIADSGANVNFGAHGGCKNGAFWGHVNVVDHSYNPPGHMDSTEITGYLMDPAVPNSRDICGFGTVSVNGSQFTARFRVRMVDNGEPGVNDRFGLALSNGYLLTTRQLAGGNIQLHKPNPSTTGPNPAPTEDQMCGGLGSP